jgi:hypothetical protein
VHAVGSGRGPRWLYELKLDGDRALVLKDGSHFEIRSRRGTNLTSSYPAIATVAKRLNAHNVVLDGEAVAVDSSGRHRFKPLFGIDGIGYTHVRGVRMRSRVKILGAAVVASFLAGGTHAFWGDTIRAIAQSDRVSVRPLFDLRSLGRSPFPSDVFTVADPHQNTGRRVNLPIPQYCRTYASDCEDFAVLNQLDGFNMQARISVPFDGDINPESVTSETIFLLKLRDALTQRESGRDVVGINYVVWDRATHELSFRPDN